MTEDPYAPRCGHRRIIADRFELVVLPDGTTTHERIPQKIRVRSADAYYCLDCSRIVDATDDAEAAQDREARHV